MSVGAEQVLKVIKGSISCSIEGEEKNFEKAEDVITFLTDRGGQRYKVTSISVENGRVALTLKEFKSVRPDSNASWLKDNREMYGTEPSAFDGM